VGALSIRQVKLVGQVGDVAVSDMDAARGRRAQAGDDRQQRRFAAARGPDQDQEFALLDLDVIPGRFTIIEPTGPETYATLQTPVGAVTVRVPGALRASVGEAVCLQCLPEKGPPLRRAKRAAAGLRRVHALGV